MNFIQVHWQFLATLISIVLVDLTLSGDNAVVIAAAARSLPAGLRRRAMLAGAACAVVTLVTTAFLASRLLNVRFLQIVGGSAVLWIAVGLFREEPPLETSASHLTSLWKAIWFIIVADITMSTDNILAVAALAHGSLALLLLGLGVSIPVVIYASGLLAALMDNYPVIIYIGAALLGRVAGQMIVTDAYTVQMFAPSAALRHSLEGAGTIGVLVTGWWLKRRS